MRTIKFRAKLALGGKWLYGSLLRLPDGRYTIYTPDKEASTSCPVIRPDTIGQFTGLRDADGKEIYEGDIVRIPEIPSVRLVVEYDTDVGAFILTEYTRTEGVIKGTMSIGFRISHRPKMQVIGNIHDNPELLSNSK
jgi:uncharacterized phage protein (TIGR01671 family)